MATASALSLTANGQPLLWATDSLREAVVRGPASLWLPYPDREFGEVVFHAVSPLNEHEAETWASGLYQAVIDFDNANAQYQNTAVEIAAVKSGVTVARGAECEHNSGLLGQQSRAVESASRRLSEMFEAGLKARDATVLSKQDLNVYLHLAARVDLCASRWHACDRCETVFFAPRKIERDRYRCPACKGKRLLPPAPRQPCPRACGACGALFEPADVRQENCVRCRERKTHRSRNPELPVEPGTQLRRSAWITFVYDDDPHSR